MARASYATVPRSILDDTRFMALEMAEQHAMLRLYVACDGHGRLPALPAIITRRTGLVMPDWNATLCALGSLVEVYEVDGQSYVQIADYDSAQTAGMLRARGESAFPAPPVAVDTESLQTECKVSTDKVQSQSVPSRVGARDARPEPEPEPEPERVTRDAHTHTRALAREGDAATPEPLPEHAEQLVEQLVHTLALRRQAYAPLIVRAPDHASAMTVTRGSLAATLRSLAALHPDAWTDVAPRFCSGGDLEDKLSQAYRPRDLAYLRSVLEGWTPDQRQRTAARNGVSSAPIGPPPGGYMRPEWGDADA